MKSKKTTQTDIGEMPEGWETTELGDPNVSEIIMGQSPPSHSYNTEGNGLPFYQGKADFGDCYPTTTKWCSSPIKIAKANDVLMSVRAPVGDVNICAENSCIGRGITAIRSKKKTDSIYLFYFLLKQKPSIEMLGTGTTFKSINKTVLEKLPITFPPLPKQKKIAKTLSIIQGAIETQDKIIANVQELKKATMEKVFTKGLNGEKTKQTEIGEMPEGWNLKTIDEFADIHNNLRQPLNSITRVEIHGDYPYCGANGIVDYINDYRFDGEYVLIAEDGGYWGNNENSSYIMNGKFWVNNHAHIVKAKGNISNNHFLCYMLNFVNLERFITGDARGKLSKSVLIKIKLPCPPLSEQEKIAEILESIDRKIGQHEAKKATLQDFFKTALDDLMKGENTRQIRGKCNAV